MNTSRNVLFKRTRNYKQCIKDAVRIQLAMPFKLRLHQFLLYHLPAAIGWTLLYLTVEQCPWMWAPYVATLLAVALQAVALAACAQHIYYYATHNAHPTPHSITYKDVWPSAINLVALRVLGAIFVGGIVLLMWLVVPPVWNYPIGLLLFLLFYFDFYFMADFLSDDKSFWHSLGDTARRLWHNPGTTLLIFLCACFAIGLGAFVFSWPTIGLSAAIGAHDFAQSIGDESTLPMWVYAFHPLWLVVLFATINYILTICRWTASLHWQSLRMHETDSARFAQEIRAGKVSN